MRSFLTVLLVFLICLLIMASCTKEASSQPPRVVDNNDAYMFDDFYQADSTYIGRKITVFADLSPRWLDTIKATISRGETWIGKSDCPPLRLFNYKYAQYQRTFYTIGIVNPPIKLLK